MVSVCSSNRRKAAGTLSPIVEQVANWTITVSFALLLGLRLLFYSSWKIIWSFQFYLPKKIRRFVLVSVCSSNRRKAALRYTRVLLKRIKSFKENYQLTSTLFFSSTKFTQTEICCGKILPRKKSAELDCGKSFVEKLSKIETDCFVENMLEIFIKS